MVNYIIFGGVKSSDYGIYISGEGVFDAPKRAVEAVHVPGRNGDIIIDQGRYENVTVKYPAFLYKSDYATFIDAIDAFRNAVASKMGYTRLMDTFHPQEYRMATFVDGMDVSPVKYNSGAEFTLEFNCKPQRWLTSGEADIDVPAATSIYNPTLYDSNPLIKIGGYGVISIEDQQIEIENALMGDITLLQNVTSNSIRAITELIGAANVSEDGDTITVDFDITYIGGGVRGVRYVNTDVSSQPAIGTASCYITFLLDRVFFKINATVEFEKGTTDSAPSTYAEYEVKYIPSGSSTVETTTIKVIPAISYDATADTVTLGAQYIYLTPDLELVERELKFKSVVVDSTKSVLGSPTYIDCDLGECYKIENGEVIDLNAYIDLGSDLPVMKPGSNDISFDNTVTSLQIVPRWWVL